MKFPRRILLLFALSVVSCTAYTVFVMANYESPSIQTWIKKTRPIIETVNSATFTRTSAFEQKYAATLGPRLEPMIHAYGFCWVLGFAFFLVFVVFCTLPLRDYYVEVTLKNYPPLKPKLDHIAVQWMGILGCWAGAAWAGGLSGIYARTAFTTLLIPGSYYFLLGFIASLLAHFRFRRLNTHGNQKSPKEQLHG